MFTLLAFSFWYFQVVQHEKFKELAENNHQRTHGAACAARRDATIATARSLVENRSSFTISIVREHTKDLDHTIRVLSEVAGLDPKFVTDIVNRHRREPTYRPIVIVDDASLAQVAAVLARRLESELPDVLVEEVPTRLYPTEAFAAHLFGYVGEASEGQVESDGLQSGAIVGQAGVEKIYNKLLMGEDGARQVKVNSMGREIETIKEIPYHEGRRVQLTIDMDLQRAAEEGFKAGGFNGAAVVMDPRTGEVLAFTSRPGYDPNDFAAGIDRTTWAGLNTDPLKPLQNRAIQGLYSPGSTFKIVVAVAALEEGIIRPDFRVSAAAAPFSSAARSNAGRKAGTAASTCATRWSSRATCTTTRSATWSASTRFTSGRPCSASVKRRASICRTRLKGSCRRPSGSESDTTRSGTPAKPFPSRSDRDRSRSRRSRSPS